MTISIVVAVSENDVIGRNGDLPWQRLSEDFRRFKLRTVGQTVVMGRKTAEHIIKRLGGPLPDRRNVVLTRDRAWHREGFEVVHSWKDIEYMAMEETIAFEGRGETFIIGGAELYTLALPHADRLYVTHVRWECEGDAFFPSIDPAVWVMTKGEEFLPDEKNPHRMTFAVYERKKLFVDVGHSRSDDQRAVMEDILAQGHCPFCPEQLPTYHKKPILKETSRWVLTESQWPYTNARVHLLAILKRHTENIDGITFEDFTELLEILTWTQATYHITGGAFCMRFGDTALSGGSVTHLHVHIISPDLSAPEYSPIRFKIG